MHLSFFSRIEQILRVICTIFFLMATCTTIIIEELVRPLYPFIDKCTGYYFSRNYKFQAVHKVIHKWFDFGVFKLLGIDCIVENRSKAPIQKGENCVVMFSHGSNLDPILVHLAFPSYLHFISKKSLFKVPFLGRALRLMGQIPLDRSNLQSAITSLDKAAKLIKVEHKSVAIAPEGTRRRKASTGPDQLLPFKKGAFHLAKKAQTDIVPIVVIGANRLWPSGSLYPQPGTLVVRFCERIYQDEVAKMSLEQLQQAVKTKFEDNLTPVDNRVIYNTDKKNYLVFLSTLIGILATWTVLIKFFFRS